MSRKYWYKEKDDGIEVTYIECLLYARSCVGPLDHTGETKFLLDGVHILEGTGVGTEGKKRNEVSLTSDTVMHGSSFLEVADWRLTGVDYQEAHTLGRGKWRP